MKTKIILLSAVILAIMTSCNKNESGYEQDGNREIRENLQNMVALVLADYKQKVPDTISVQVPYKELDYIPYIEEQDPTHTFTFDEMVGVAATCRLYYFYPGTAYHYSNTGYSILGKIIERVSGQSYQQFLMEHIVQPMGLASTTFPYLGTDIQIPSPLARGYIYTPDTLADATESNISANVAEGYLSRMVTDPEEATL